MKAIVAAFNQEKALVGAFSVIVQPVVEPMDRFAALLFTQHTQAEKDANNLTTIRDTFGISLGMDKAGNIISLI